MELPRRAEEDRFTLSGRYGELESQIRRHVRRHAVPILLMHAFDMRTRIGPYVFTDKVLVPGALPAVAAALYAHDGIRRTSLPMADAPAAQASLPRSRKR